MTTDMLVGAVDEVTDNEGCEVVKYASRPQGGIASTTCTENETPEWGCVAAAMIDS
jgi:hypothetical protein